MPAPEVSGLYDHAVIWAATGLNSYGRAKLASPVEIPVRWDDVRQESGRPQDTVESWPVTAVVDQDVTVGSIMWRGRLVDLPSPPVDLYLVVAYNATPDIKGRHTFRSITLTKYSDSLPEMDS